MDSQLASTNVTSVLALNDDYFLEVFKWLDLMDLCAVAGVCTRFRKNVKLCFEYSKKKNLNLRFDFVSDGDSVNIFLLKTSKILRHFGVFLNKFDDEAHWISQEHWCMDEGYRCRRRIMKLVTRYCSGTLIQLSLFAPSITDNSMRMMKPLLEFLQTLEMRHLAIGQSFLDMLAECPKLRELKLSIGVERFRAKKKLKFDRLFSLKNLVKISLTTFWDLQNSDIDELLHHNLQMKEIELEYCQKLDCHIFRSIANHTPNVEKLFFSCVRSTFAPPTAR